MNSPPLDEIGPWSEIKLEIVREYAFAYSTIMRKQKEIRRYLYIDAFAGSGWNISGRTGELVPGSPLNALWLEHPFSEYHFMDLDGQKVDRLRAEVGDRPDVHVHTGDCNEILLREVFPRCRYEDFRRALCLLDPYGLNVRWDVLAAAGWSGSVEVFYNFSIMDANRNVLHRDPATVLPEQVERFEAVWGDSSWPDATRRTLPRRPGVRRPRPRAGGLPAGRGGRDRGDGGLRNGDRQARHPLRRPPRHAAIRGGVFPGDRPRRPGRGAGRLPPVLLLGRRGRPREPLRGRRSGARGDEAATGAGDVRLRRPRRLPPRGPLGPVRRADPPPAGGRATSASGPTSSPPSPPRRPRAAAAATAPRTRRGRLRPGGARRPRGPPPSRRTATSSPA